MTYAEVAINTAVNQTFHYAIPPSWQSRLVVGHLVRVSFGTAMQAGIVVAIHDELPPELHDVTMKPIIDVLHPEPVMVQAHIDLALWMSEAYLASPGTCLWLMLPPGIVGKSTQQVFLGDAQPDDPDSLTTTQQKILEALNEEAPRSVDELVKITDVKSVRRVIKQLEEANLVEMTAVLNPPTATRKTVRTVMRAIPEDEVVDALASLQRAPKQTSVFAYIAKHDYPLDVSDVYEAIDATSADLNNLERKGFVELGERIVFRDSLADRNFIPSQPLALTTAQNDVWQRIRASLQQNYSADSENIEKDFLLHGVTGAGKTEIYLHAIAETLAQGRQALFLVPEIALTPQTIRRVAQRFPEKVAVVHGSLSTGERFDTWRRARDGDISVIVGTRSALFTPLPDVGLIILDESHDHSYKQSPPINPPYYNARDVAQKLAKLNDATLIFGSATPAIETMYAAKNGNLTLLELPNRIMGHRQRVQKQAKQRGVTLAYQPADSDDAMTIGLPPVDVVDMREELKAGNLSMFSRDLQASLQGVLERGEQAILFLNRRGQATYVFCRDCGYVVECPNCDTPLTYHRHGEAMRCHHCGHQQPAPDTCPNCSSRRIRYFGAGTQHVESALREHFPRARILRWDRDTASNPQKHENILARFAEGEADILVGTQMIAKGLDIPFVTLVGVVSADPGLALPDFRAQERAFQLLTQVAGRAGRSILGGHVIIQTYQPDHPSIIAAAQHDYASFYQTEITARREMGYPPFRRLGRILVQDTHPIEAERQIRAAAEQLVHRITKENLTDTHLIGPAPCFFSRIDRHYRWQVLVRSSDPAQVLNAIQARNGWYIDIDPVDIL